MKYALIFRRLKNVKYSYAPLIASLEQTSYYKYIDIYFINNINEIVRFDEKKYSQLIIAFSFMTFDLDKIVLDLKNLANLNLKTPFITIAGGPHISGDPESGKIMGFNSIFIGDGEATIRQFFEDLINNKPEQVYDGRLQPIDLNHYPPFPTSPKFQMVIPIEITRGCPFGCKYCATSYIRGRNIRERDINEILTYLKWCVKHDKTMARFISPNAFGFKSPNGIKPNIEALETLLAGLKQIGIEQTYLGTFPSEVRPESVTTEVLKLVKKYCNNKSIVIGVQTGSERMLKEMGRGHDLIVAERAISLTKEFGFEPIVDFIFGLPGENDSDREKTIKWMEKIYNKYNARVHAHVFMPLVGSPWADKKAEPLNPEIIYLLGKLAANQQLFGQWTTQEKLAKKIETWKKRGLISTS